MNWLRKSIVPRNICVFGANELAVSVSAVLAYKCPDISVSVVDFNSSEVVQWNKKKVKGQERDLEKLLEKCQRQNLSFVTNITEAIFKADIILLMIDRPDTNDLNILNLKEFEKAAKLIAEVSSSNKIIVQKCLNVPLRTCENLKMSLNANKMKKTKFQILAMPEFFSSVSPVTYLLNPDFVFIGHEESQEGEKAAAAMVGIYTRWVPKEKIKMMNWATAELSKIAINALLAQKSIMVGALAAICERSRKDFYEITRVLTKTKLGDRTSEFSMGDVNLYRDSLRLIDLCQEHGFNEKMDYWREMINQNEYQEKRFMKKILCAFFNTLVNKKLVMFGLSFKGNGKITSDLPAIRLSARILEEKGSLCLYEPNVQMSKEVVLEAMKECGAENVDSHVMLFDDPYEAVEKAHGIIICTDSKAFKALDYAAIYKDMRKPAYVFDGRNALDHESLIKIGFKVKTIGGGY